MGFLDNSGDIILDAVLTDHGRKVLAKGDGSFQITKFALGDEEVDYSLYDTTNTNGSAYYDLEILQTPILEAFTDNAVSMKSKLVTYESLELLYLPVIKLNEISDGTTTARHSSGSFIIAVDGLTENDNGSTSTQNGIGYDSTGTAIAGILFGQTTSTGGRIRLDQGLDTDAITPAQNLSADMVEESYTIQIDNRLGNIRTVTGGNVSLDYIDDDNIAYYTVTSEDGVITSNPDKTANSTGQVIEGPRGTILEFKIGSSLSLQTSTYLFTQLGSTSRLDNRAGSSSEVYHIDTLVRVTGMNTGYTIDVPVRFVKFKST
tara:strand:- start:2747 stop:3700 length:954 start_codon:yes stop_codon:yes gene_type:complete